MEFSAIGDVFALAQESQSLCLFDILYAFPEQLAMQAVPATFRALLAAFLWVACSALRSDKFTIRNFENETAEGLNPPSQLGRHVSRFASRTVQSGLSKAKPTNALKGFQFRGKPGGGAFNGFAKPPGYAFKGFGPNQFGGGGLARGLGSGLGRGHFGGMTNQLGRMPGMHGAKRFASGNAQVLTKNVHTLGFQNLNSLGSNMQHQIVEAVTRASQLPTSEIASSIRRSLWQVFQGAAQKDCHVLVTRSEVGIGRAAKDFVGRFKIQKAGKDLYVTILKRAEVNPPYKVHVNPGVGESDLQLLKTFGRGLLHVQNIFSRNTLVYMRKLVREAVDSGLSESGMAKQLESAIQQKWGRGWNIVVSRTETQVATNLNDMAVKFKVNDIFITILRQRWFP